MIASLDLVRSPLGPAQTNLAGLVRKRPAEARFGKILLPFRLQLVPLPLPRPTCFGFLGIWDDADAVARFRAEGLLRRRAGEHLALDLRPLRGFGSWDGAEPLAPVRAEDEAGDVGEDADGPILQVTHSRTRPRKMARFMLADRPVVAALGRQPGRVWSDGFADGLLSFDTGTLSLWRSAADADRFAYAPGVHRQAVAAERDGGWFSESWFGRFAVERARGGWRGLDLGAL